MKVFSVCGITKSGKTTTIEALIRGLARRGYRVGSVKEIHFEAFAIDPLPASNTNRHRAAGSTLVTARGYHETDVLFGGKLAMKDILAFYSSGYDYVVLEGVDDIPVPTIVTAHNDEDLAAKWSGNAFCVSGRISETIAEYRGKPAISALADIEALLDLVERTVYESLPFYPPECCAACGYTCATLGAAILSGEADRSRCVADQGIRLSIGGKPVTMVPFVQKILRNAVLGVVGELDGYQPGASVELRL